MKARPVLDAEGRVEMVINISEDVTALKELDLQRQGFLSAAAHDLKSPLTTIRGFAQLLRRRLERTGLDPVAGGEMLSAIEAATAKMTGLIDELLDVARMEASGSLTLNAQPCDLVDIARAVLAEQRAVSDIHQLLLKPDVPAVVGDWDAGRLDRVVTNLVANAIKFSPDGGHVVVRVSREESEESAWAVLSVQDSGIGIRDCDVERVFQRFERGGNADRIVGSGIGLAYAREVALKHGGDITVTSAVGLGSTFSLRLPLSPGQS
ncbi:MAG: HAMP domain-containing histidine kinase [Chloroflexi bacterium]|nr:HAMP domain-containing histidine kinase [Chloroflexota bacterium]